METFCFEVIALHNTFINAHFTMELLQMRLFIAALARLPFEEEEFNALLIPSSELIEERGRAADNVLKQLCSQITSLVITIEMLEEGTPEEGKDSDRRNIALLAEATYRADSNGVLITLNPLLKPYLLRLKQSGNFTTADLHELRKLHSPHAFRIYWLLKEYSACGERIISLVDLRDTLGIGAKKYAKLANFWVPVLDEAQRQLAQTDLPFTYEMREHEGKVAVAFRFPPASTLNSKRTKGALTTG